ncbi:MAG: O-antigen ligase family protein [Clostridiaceae bacterium]|nr:O-antigen ligase family protein [Clostridiaceae bacterium]
MMIFVILYLLRQNRLSNILASTPGSQYLILFCPLTLIVSMVRDNPDGVLLAYAFSAFFLIALFIRSVMTRALFEGLIATSCAASAFSFLVIVFQRLFCNDNPLYRASSSFMNANYYAAATEVLILFCFYKCFILPSADHQARKFYLAALLWNVLGLYLSDCRTAFIALGIAIPVMLIMNGQKKTLVFTLSLEALVLIAVTFLPDLFPRLSDTASDLDLRIGIWQTALLGIVRQPLFGWGGDAYIQIFSRYGGPEATHAHNLFLDPLLNYGIAGTVLLGLYVRSNLRAIRCMQLYKQDRPRYNLVAAVLTAVFIHGITDIAMFSVQTGLLLAIVLAVAGINENQRQIIPHLRKYPIWAEQPLSLRVDHHRRPI